MTVMDFYKVARDFYELDIIDQNTSENLWWGLVFDIPEKYMDKNIISLGIGLGVTGNYSLYITI